MHVSGDAIRQENGSHIDVGTWNASFAFGHKMDKKGGCLWHTILIALADIEGSLVTMSVDSYDNMREKRRKRRFFFFCRKSEEKFMRPSKFVVIL